MLISLSLNIPIYIYLYFCLKNMKKIVLSLVLLGIGSICIHAQSIKEIKIGNSVWMADNLKTNIKGSCSYNDDPKNDSKYGRLYTWEVSKNACPIGWHLPNEKEWDQLIEYLGGNEYAGKKLKVGGSSGFNALLAGFSNVGGFMLINSYGSYWTSTSFDDTHAWYIFLNSKDDLATKTYFTKTYGLSVRCKKN